MPSTGIAAWGPRHAYDGGERYGYADRGSVSLHLTERNEHDPDREGAVVYLHVSDADALHAEWKESGVPGRLTDPTDTPYRLREFAFVDRDGTAHRVGSPLASTWALRQDSQLTRPPGDGPEPAELLRSMIVHRLSDLDAVGDHDSQARALARGLLGDCSTKIIYQQETSEAAHTAALLGLTSAEHAQLPDLQRGEGLWHVGSHAFIVRHATTAVVCV